MRPRGGRPLTESPLLVDLFCGAGGASVGYHRAGFRVVGVDIEEKPDYPFPMVRANALEVALDWTRVAVVHASPPCQAHTQMSARWRGRNTKADTHEDWLTPTREWLPTLGIPYVIENVPGATHHMNKTVTLHGGMFGLGVYRPRLFESNLMLLAARAPKPRNPIGVYGTRPDGRTTYRLRNNGHGGGKSVIRAAKGVEEAQEVMGIDWMSEWRDLCEAIPPAYTELLGRQLIEIC